MRPQHLVNGAELPYRKNLRSSDCECQTNTSTVCSPTRCNRNCEGSCLFFVDPKILLVKVHDVLPNIARHGACYPLGSSSMFVPHGDVGDWRLSDEEFLKSFRLPCSRCEALSERNPFPRENRIVFHEGPHTYTVDGLVMPRSVTGLIHHYTTKFDAPSTINQMMARASWALKKNEYLKQNGEVMSPGEIADKWQRNGLVQRSRGTLFHYHCEMFLNGATLEGPPSPEFYQWLQIYENVVTSNAKVHRTELSVFHVGLQVAGQIDCLRQREDGLFVIWDWKRSKEIKYESIVQMRPPLTHLPDSNYWTYALQRQREI